MSDDPDAAAVKTNGQLWLVLMLSASIVSLGGVLWQLVRVLRTTDEIEHGFDEMPETVTNIPQRQRVATVEVANEVDGNVFVRFDDATWSLPAPGASSYAVAQQRLREQLGALVKERAAARPAAHFAIYAWPPPRPGKPDTGTLLVLDIVRSAGIDDVVFISDEVPEVPR